MTHRGLRERLPVKVKVLFIINGLFNFQSNMDNFIYANQFVLERIKWTYISIESSVNYFLLLMISELNCQEIYICVE